VSCVITALQRWGSKLITTNGNAHNPVYFTSYYLFIFSVPVMSAEKRFAKPGDGVQVNQAFVSLEDGTLYALRDKKVGPDDCRACA
jgi:hypothetical protein